MTLRTLALALFLSTAAQAQSPLPNNYKTILNNHDLLVMRVHYGPHEVVPMHDHSAYPTVFVYLNDSGIIALEDVKIKLPDALRIRVPLHIPDAQLLTKLEALFRSAPGAGKLMLRLEEADQFAVDLEPHLTVAADVAFIEQVESLVGRGAVQVIQ